MSGIRVSVCVRYTCICLCQVYVYLFMLGFTRTCLCLFYTCMHLLRDMRIDLFKPGIHVSVYVGYTCTGTCLCNVYMNLFIICIHVYVYVCF